jgi:hypothetical protein
MADGAVVLAGGFSGGPVSGGQERLQLSLFGVFRSSLLAFFLNTPGA